jgi:hypothetical protein
LTSAVKRAGLGIAMSRVTVEEDFTVVAWHRCTSDRTADTRSFVVDHPQKTAVPLPRDAATIGDRFNACSAAAFSPSPSRNSSDVSS